MGSPHDSSKYSSTDTDAIKAPKDEEDVTEIDMSDTEVGDNPGGGGDDTPTSNPPTK